MACCLAADFGGTEIKLRLLSEDGAFLTPVYRFPSHSREDAPRLLAHFRQIIAQVLAQAPGPVARAGLAFPGPFDYDRGIPYMQGIHKYDALHGMDLRAFLESCFPQTAFRFANDADLFGLGEYRFGGRPHGQRVMYICIGTGLGSCFIENGALVRGKDGVPASGWIYAEPFEGDTIDNRLSASALRREMDTSPALRALPDVRAAAEAARAGNPDAQALFTAFGETLSRAIPPFLQSFGAQELVVGGQVAKSFPLFSAPLLAACRGLGVQVFPCPRSDDFAMRGTLCLFQ